MGLAADLALDLKEAFIDDESLADTVQNFILTQINRGSSVYDSLTGSYSESVTTYSSSGIPIGYDQLERFNTHIEPTDLDLIVLAQDISTIPKVKDRIVMDGREYSINKFEVDPLGVTYTLGLEGVDT